MSQTGCETATMRMRGPVALLALLALAPIDGPLHTRVTSDHIVDAQPEGAATRARSAREPGYLIRVEHADRVDAQQWHGDSADVWLLLRSLSGETWVRYVSVTSPDAGHASGLPVWEVVLRVDGPASPSRAVVADWKVADPSRAAAFEESRRALFLLRREHIPTFAGDLLMRRVDGHGEYSVLGLYADDEGLALSRGHPAIQSYAASAPASRFAATDVSGMRFFAIDRR